MATLKQFIRSVRAARTIADERAVIQKESAAIRASFREESHNFNIRRNNVIKLLYLFTLGERTHFGQIECLKLLASPRFADKRIGYLGTMLLLDENQEVLTLVTNSLKSDLNHSNQYVVGLSLVTLGNIASIEMSRDLFPEVETLITSSNPYIRRKAALCAMRLCRKVPDLLEHFIDKANMLLADRNHGVLLCGVTFITTVCEMEDSEDFDRESVLAMFRPAVPGLVKTLKNLTSSGYSPEHDVAGITDPFLQVKILGLLRVLGMGDAETSELMGDILTQVATNTDSSKNVGNAILYEAVLTILEVEADLGLRVLGVNILGKFLANRDNNIRYVALNTLTKVVAIEPNAVQRHRNTILACLRDPDISIRRRALELSFTLINESNVRVLIRELLSFLEVADAEFKPTMTSQIGIAADRFAPSKRWHFDTMHRVLKLAGNYVKEQILSSFVHLIASSPELQTYASQKLYASLSAGYSQEGLILVGSWVIGEYADALLLSGAFEENGEMIQINESDLIDLFTCILESSYSSVLVTEYVVTAMMKLTTRLKDPSQIERVRTLLRNYQTNLDVEVQQRAVEYTNLFTFDEVLHKVFEHMPPPEIREEKRVLGQKNKKYQNNSTKKKSLSSSEDVLLDLMGGVSVEKPVKATDGNVDRSNADLLADILGGNEEIGTSTAGTTNELSNSRFNGAANSDSINSLPVKQDVNLSGEKLESLLVPTNLSTLSQVPTTGTVVIAYEKNNLLVSFRVQRISGVAQVLVRFLNTSTATISPIRDISMQVAVPKSQKIQIHANNLNNLEAGGEGFQTMRIVNGNGTVPVKLRLRIRLSYIPNGKSIVTEQFDWTENT